MSGLSNSLRALVRVVTTSEWRASSGRLIAKGLFLALGIYALLYVSWPTQAKSWGLWITDQDLARNTALVMTMVAALSVSVSTWAISGGKRLAGIGGLLLSVGVFAMTILASWNFYLHESTKNGTAVLEASQRVASASSSRISELQAELKAIDERELATIAPLDARIATLPPGPTLRQVSASKDAALTRFAEQRKPLQDELAELRRRDTQIDNRAGIVNTTPVDSRPLDVELSIWLKVPRTQVGSWLDFIRSLVTELYLMLFLPLVLADQPPPREARRRGRFAQVWAALLDSIAGHVRASIPVPPKLADDFDPPRPASRDDVAAVVAVAREVARGYEWPASFELCELVVALARALSTPAKDDPAKDDPPPPPPPPPSPPPPKGPKGLREPTDAELAAARARKARQLEPAA